MTVLWCFLFLLFIISMLFLHDMIKRLEIKIAELNSKIKRIHEYLTAINDWIEVMSKHKENMMKLTEHNSKMFFNITQSLQTIEKIMDDKYFKKEEKR